MLLKFTKMHGLGNDFVVIDAISQSVALTSEQVRFIADRHFGVGCDQLLLVERTRSPGVDFSYRIYNADGGEVEQCGNGARCFMRFVRDAGLTDKNELVVETRCGIIRPRMEPDGQVTVDMGVPRTRPDEVPFIAEHESLSYPLLVDGQQIELGVVSMGNPHAVLRVDDVARAPVATLGPKIEAHERFPNRVNAGFMQIVDRAHIRLRVFERGVGETLACGSGACAAVVVGHRQGLLDDKVDVELPGGRLLINWRGNGTEVRMTGPATRVFEGQLKL
ncbi:MAG: diaminopimelate epimerase [Proteobacteria bacterium]|nr:diaminopimelate epimerase [Pseudomonadota bacterium]